MSSPQLKSLSNTESLKDINRNLLIEFLNYFKSLLGPDHLTLLKRELSPEGFYAGLSVFLAEPQQLPAPIRDALAAIEDLAAPQNRDRLNLALFHAPLSLNIDPRAPAFQQALHLWLHKPYQLLPPLSAAAPNPSEGGLVAPKQSVGESNTPALHHSSAPSGSVETQNSKFENPLAPEPISPTLQHSTPPIPTPPIETQKPKIKNPNTSPLQNSITPSPSSPIAPSLQDSTTPRLRFPLAVFFFELDQTLFHEFIRVFQTDLQAKYPQLPQPCPGNSDFIDAVADLLTEPDALPPRMYEAMLAIQELASPLNGPLLHALLLQSGTQPDESWPQEDKALQFWLHCPFTLDRIDALRAQIPEPPEPALNGNGNGTDDTPSPLSEAKSRPVGTLPTPHAALPTPHSVLADRQVPGDLAAIARFPRHKISHLPPAVRDSINRMLRQRVSYTKILEQLGDHGKNLNKNNLSRWRKTGYLLWLAEQQRREDAQSQLQLLFDVLRENENGKIHEATQQIAALRISQVLAAFDPATLTQKLEQHPQAFVRLIQTLPNLSRGGMDCERILLDLSERKASLQKELKPGKRGISPQTMKYFEQKLHLM